MLIVGNCLRELVILFVLLVKDLTDLLGLVVGLRLIFNQPCIILNVIGYGSVTQGVKIY